MLQLNHIIIIIIIIIINSVKFVNLSFNSLGVFSKECLSFLNMLSDLGLDKRHQYFAI